MAILSYKKIRIRLKILLVIFIYISVYTWSHVAILLPWTSPFYRGQTIEFTKYYYYFFILSILPVFWMPHKIIYPSQILNWLIYLFMYIPIMIIPVFNIFYSNYERIEILITFFISFIIIQIPYLLNKIKIYTIPVEPFIQWGILIGVTFFFVVIIYATIGSSMTLVFNIFDPKAVNSQRFVNSIEKGTVSYPINLLSSVVAPLLLSYGLCFRKYRLMILPAVALQLFVYSTGANKSFVLAVFIMTFIFLLLRKSTENFGIKLALSVSTISVIMLYTQLCGDHETQQFYLIPAMLWLSRFVGINGFNFELYHEFFKTHPYTYYSHVNIINKFVIYPYEWEIGLVIGKEYTAGVLGWQANAGFWITDGIAAAGTPGIFIASFICAALFWLFDSISTKHDLVFACVLTSYAAISFLNVSIFTTLITGGWGFIMIILFFAKETKSNRMVKSR